MRRSAPSFRLLPSAALTAAVLAVTSSSAGRADSALVEDAYRSAVAAWAAGSFGDAYAAVAELEERFTGGEAIRCIDWAESHTARELAAADPEALLPLLALQVNLWRLHIRDHAFWLALMTRERLEPWLDLYVERAEAGGTARAARLLVFWADSMLASGFPQDTRRLLDRALRYSPELSEALYLRALVAERSWEYEEALPYLRQLLTLDPGDHHARLRYGVNAGRIGRVEEAVFELAAVARSEAEPWSRIIAYEELGRLEAGRGRLEEAITTVQESLGHFPESEQLALQLAFFLRLRDDRPSLLAGHILDAWVEDTGAAPRFRYEHEPRNIDELARRLAEDVESRRSRLGRALEEVMSASDRESSPHCRRKARLLR